MREPPRIPEERLRACLQNQYDLDPVTLTFLPLGKDYNAGVYRVVSDQGTAYLLKVTSRPLYEPSCLVPHFLSEARTGGTRGTGGVVRPSDPPTRRNLTLKSSSTSSQDSRAMTVADKEGITETPLFNGLAACAARGSRA